MHASSDGEWLALTAHVYPIGIFFSSGVHWKVARQFTVRTLQSLGVRQPPMVGKVLQELVCLKGQLDSYGGEWGTRLPLPGVYAHLRPVFLRPPGQPFPLALLGWAPCNITFTLLFGQRFDYQDPVFVSLLSLIDQVMVLLGSPGIQVRGLPPGRERSGTRVWGPVLNPEVREVGT